MFSLALSHRVLGQLSRKEKACGSLNLPRRESLDLPAAFLHAESVRLRKDMLEGVADEGVQDGHALLGHAGVGMDLFQHIVDEGVVLGGGGGRGEEEERKRGRETALERQGSLQRSEERSPAPSAAHRLLRLLPPLLDVLDGLRGGLLGSGRGFGRSLGHLRRERVR